MFGTGMVYSTGVNQVFSALLHNKHFYLKTLHLHEGLLLGGVDDSKSVEDF